MFFCIDARWFLSGDVGEDVDGVYAEVEDGAGVLAGWFGGVDVSAGDVLDFADVGEEFFGFCDCVVESVEVADGEDEVVVLCVGNELFAFL